MNLYQILFTPNPFLRVVSSFHPSTTLFLVGILEGFKELKSKHLTWKKVIKNRLDVFATPMSFREPKTW